MGRDGGVRSKEAGDRGLVVAEMVGARLGAEVVKLSEEMACGPCGDQILTKRGVIELPGQEMLRTELIRPTHEYAFEAAPSRAQSLEIIRMGDVALVGVAPELSCSTGAEIREGSPFPATLVLTMVNGAAKYMADAGAYERITYEAMNSLFARGSAEMLAEKALGMLRDMARS